MCGYCGYCGFRGFEMLLKTAITVETALSLFYLKRIFPLIFRDKGFLNEVSADFLEMSVNVSAGSP